jgi:hypothetical protein
MRLIGFGGMETSPYSGSESSTPPENGRSDEMYMASEQSTTVTMQNIEVARGERTDFEPHAVSDGPERETTQSHSVRFFFLEVAIPRVYGG